MISDLKYDTGRRCYSIFGFEFSREFVDGAPWVLDVILHALDRDSFVFSMATAGWVHTGSICRVHPGRADVLELHTNRAWRNVGKDIREDILRVANHRDVGLIEHLWKYIEADDVPPDWTPEGIGAELRHLAGILDGETP